MNNFRKQLLVLPRTTRHSLRSACSLPHGLRTTARGGYVRGYKNAAQECACREAIRSGERNARTAKQPQGPARGEKMSCFYKLLELFPFELIGKDEGFNAVLSLQSEQSGIVALLVKNAISARAWPERKSILPFRRKCARA